MHSSSTLKSVGSCGDTLCAVEDLHLHSVDITSAFPNGDLDEEIYMIQPEGYHQGGAGKVLKLHKSLYGLKQAARQWNKRLHSVLLHMGFKQLQSDHSIYLYNQNEVHIIMPIYIDDITLASSNAAALDSTVKELASHFKLHDLGETKFLLGIEVSRNHSNHSISLSQCQYIIDMLERFNMSDCNPVCTPISPGTVLSKSMAPQTLDDVQEMASVPYLSAVGSLLYLATTTHQTLHTLCPCLHTLIQTQVCSIGLQ